MDQKELDAKVADINAANNKLIADLQVEYDRKLKGHITEAQFNDIKTTWDKRWDEVGVELAKLKSPAINADAIKGKIEESPHAKAFHKYLIKGEKELTPEETKVLQIGQPTYAGYLAPYEYTNAIIQGFQDFSPIRRIASVQQTSAYAVEFPSEDTLQPATWVAETVEKTADTSPTFKLIEIKMFEMKNLYLATQKMLEDSQFNLEAELASIISRKFGLLEGTAFCTGNGSSAPEGFTINTTVLADTSHTTTSNVLVMDDFYTAYYALASPYIPNATWVMNRSVVALLVGFKAATTNTYLLEPNLQAAQPMRFLGVPIVECPDLPTGSLTPADEVIIAAIGDFRAGYKIIDRIDITIQRLVEKYAELGEIGFLARKRVGGGVVLPEAIQLLSAKT